MGYQSLGFLKHTLLSDSLKSEEDSVDFFQSDEESDTLKMLSSNQSSLTYQPFKKKFYLEPYDTPNLSDTEDKINTVKVLGHNVPNPISSWYQAGIDSRIIELQH